MLTKPETEMRDRLDLQSEHTAPVQLPMMICRYCQTLAPRAGNILADVVASGLGLNIRAAKQSETMFDRVPILMKFRRLFPSLAEFADRFSRYYH